MKFAKLLLIGAALFTFTACNGGGNDAGPAPASNKPTVANAIDTATSGALAPSGETAATSDVISQEFCTADSCIASDDTSWDAIFADHQGLEDNFMALKSITKVVYTSAGTYDLYAGDALMMTLSPGADNNGWAVSANGIDNIDIQAVTLQTTASSEQEQASLDSINFVLQSCVTEQQQQQGKDQTQTQEGKDQTQQGKRGDTTTVQQGKDQTQQQGQDQQQQGKEEVKPTCDMFNVTLFLQAEQPKDQEQQQQGKDQTQEGKDQTQQGKDQTPASK